MKNIFLSICWCLAFVQPSWAKELNVVTTQAIFADLVRHVGGPKVHVTVIASPKYNIHLIQPKPSDVKKVFNADLYVNGGLDLEAWSDPLLEAAGRPELFRNGPRNVDLSAGIKLLNVPQGPVSRAEGDIHLLGNPHFHMNPANARVMIQTIATRLAEVDSENTGYYQSNAKNFIDRLEQKIMEWKGICAHCQGKEIIAYHDEVVYLMDFLGMKDEQFLEPKPGIPPTPKHLEFLAEYARFKDIKAISVAPYYSREMAKRLSQRLGVSVITIAQQPGQVPGAEDFFTFFDYNIKQISGAVA